MGNSSSVEATNPAFEQGTARGAAGKRDGQDESHEKEPGLTSLSYNNSTSDNKNPRTMSVALPRSESGAGAPSSNEHHDGAADGEQPRTFSASSLFGVMASTATSLLSSLPSSSSAPPTQTPTKGPPSTSTSRTSGRSEEGAEHEQRKKAQDSAGEGKYDDGDEKSSHDGSRSQGRHKARRRDMTETDRPVLVRSGVLEEERFGDAESPAPHQESRGGGLGSLASAAAVHSSSGIGDVVNMGRLPPDVMGTGSPPYYGNVARIGDKENNGHASLATLAAAANAVYPNDSNDLSQAVAYGSSAASFSNNEQGRFYHEDEEGVMEEEDDDEDEEDEDEDGGDDEDEDERKDDMKVQKPVPNRSSRATGRSASSSHHSKFSIVDKPRATDILCGRGGGSIHHEGNKRFREEDVHPYFQAWSEASKTEKTRIARKIVKKIRDSGRRVLEKRGALWVNVTHNNTRVQTKIAQRLREYKDVLRRMAERGESPPKGTIPAVPLKVAVAEDDDEPPKPTNKEKNLRGEEGAGSRGKRDKEFQRRNAESAREDYGSAQRLSGVRRETELDTDVHYAGEEANKRRKTVDGRDRPDVVASGSVLPPTAPPGNVPMDMSVAPNAALRKENTSLFGRHGADLVNAAQTDLRINDIVIPNPRAGGRGEQRTQDHEGNHRFRTMIKLELDSYFATAPGMDRVRPETQSFIVQEVFARVSKLNPPGRFLCAATQSSSPSAFVEVPIEVALRFIENAFLIAGVMHGRCSAEDARLPPETVAERTVARQVGGSGLALANGDPPASNRQGNIVTDVVADDYARSLKNLGAGASPLAMRAAESHKPLFDSTRMGPKTARCEGFHGFSGQVEVTPQTNDVLCGDDAQFFNHVGNRRFRILIELFLPEYRELVQRRADESEAFHGVIESIHACDPPGRFLVRGSEGEGWEEMDQIAALRKTEQTFRLCDSFYRKRSLLPKRFPNVAGRDLISSERVQGGTKVVRKPRDIQISRIMVSNLVEHQHGLFVNMLQKELATTGKESDEDDWDGSAEWANRESNFFKRKSPNSSTMDVLRSHYKESAQELQKAREEARARAHAARHGIMGWPDAKRSEYQASANTRAGSLHSSDSQEATRKWAPPLAPQGQPHAIQTMGAVDFRQRTAQPSTLAFNSSEMGVRAHPSAIFNAPMGPPPSTLARGAMSKSLKVANAATEQSRAATLNLPAMMLQSQRMHQNVMNAGGANFAAATNPQSVASALGQNQERGSSTSEGMFSRKVEPSMNSMRQEAIATPNVVQGPSASLPGSKVFSGGGGTAVATNSDDGGNSYTKLPGKHIFQLTSAEPRDRPNPHVSSATDSSSGSWMGAGMLQQQQQQTRDNPHGAPASYPAAEITQKLQQQQQSLAQSTASTSSSKAWMDKVTMMQQLREQQADPRGVHTGDVRVPSMLPHQNTLMHFQSVRQDTPQSNHLRLQHASSMDAGLTNRNPVLIAGSSTTSLTPPPTHLQNHSRHTGSVSGAAVGQDKTVLPSSTTAPIPPVAAFDPGPFGGSAPSSHIALPAKGSNSTAAMLSTAAQATGQPTQEVARPPVGEVCQTSNGHAEPDRGQFDDA